MGGSSPSLPLTYLAGITRAPSRGARIGRARRPNFTFPPRAHPQKLDAVLGDESTAARSFTDLRSALPADATLQNLLRTLSAKLETCGRLPVLEYEAHVEGHEACATTFGELADVERRSFEELLVCLRSHLDATKGPLSAPADKTVSKRGDR